MVILLDTTDECDISMAIQMEICRSSMRSRIEAIYSDSFLMSCCGRIVVLL